MLTDRDEMCNIYRGPSINASYQVSVHFGKVASEEKNFLEINQSETRVVGQMSVLATGSVMLLQCGKGKPP